MNGHTYLYSVSALNAGGESAPCAPVTAAPLSPPTVPSGLAAAAGNGEIQLTWNASTGATTYNLKWSTTPGGPYTTISVASTSYTHSGLPNNTKYYYVVSGVGTIGEGPNSAEVSATTLSPPPPPPRTAKLGNDTGRCGCAFIPATGVAAWGWTLLALAAALSLALRR